MSTWTNTFKLLFLYSLLGLAFRVKIYQVKKNLLMNLSVTAVMDQRLEHLSISQELPLPLLSQIIV